MQSTEVGLFVIQNPVAGPGDDDGLDRRVGALLQARGVRHFIAHTRERGDAQELADQALAAGWRRIVVAGGDGTVREVVGALADRDADLALLPMGTGNQLAANLGIPRRLDQALDVALDGVTRPIDVGMINGHAFACIAGAGFDASVVSPGPDVKRRVGYLAYVYSAAATIFAPAHALLHVTVDGHQLTSRGIGVEVTNMPGISGPWLPRPVRIVPDGHADDGKLEVCVLAIESRLDALLALGAIVSQRYDRDRRLCYLQGCEIAVESEPSLLVQADGEQLGKTPFRASVRPRALNVVTPRIPTDNLDSNLAFTEDAIPRP